MDTSNLQRLCCISRENCNLKNIIEQQSSTIGVLLQEKRNLQEKYENLLMSIDMSSITSNIVENSSNIENTSKNKNTSKNNNTSNISF